jgi:signal transduction histidine kinase/ligand-binding sensor domain-containing protein
MWLRAWVTLILGVAALAAHRLPIKVYTTVNGMPRNSARCLMPDASGMIWICTSEGLVRFDGYQFRIFGPEQGLPSRGIVDFVVSRKGGYWVVTDAGVCRLPAASRVGDRCRPLEVDGPAGDYQTDGLVESADGNTWVITLKGVFHVSADGRKLEPTPLHSTGANENFDTAAVAPDGTLLGASDNAIFQWKPGEVPRDITSRFAPWLGVNQIVTDAAGVVWVVAPNWLYRLTGWGSARSPAIQRFAYPSGRTSRILQRRDGSRWLYGDGISRVEIGPSGKLVEGERYSRREGLPPAEVTLLAEDRQGNLWGSTGGSGIFRIAGSGFKIYSQEDGLASSRIAAIFESLRGDICVITGIASPANPVNFAVKNGSRFETVAYRRPPGAHDPGWGWDQFGLQAHDGEWWLPSGDGLFRFARSARPQGLAARSPMAVYGRSSQLGEEQIFRVFEDSHGDIWISGLTPSDVLVRWERGTGSFHRATQAEGWPEGQEVHAIREARSGTIWIGTFGSLVRYRNRRFEPIPALPSGQNARVRDLYIDRAGRVWVATSLYGLYRSDNPDDPHPLFRNYTTREGLASDSVRSITEDDAGLIYAGTVRGIDRIDPAAPAGAHRIHHFTTADGVPDNEQNVAFHDRHGHLWFGTLDGLAEFDPSQGARIDPPDVYVTRLRVRGEEIPLPWAGARTLRVSLPHDRNQFEIQYAGIDLRSVASLRYQYRLLGLDRDWSQPVDDVSVNYASLPSGNFRFEVRALTADGQIGAGLASFQLSVQQPLWQRWWFITLAGISVALTAAALYRYRVEQLLAMERLRTRIASDLHDDIGASLTQISILTELARRGASRDVLEDVAGIAREVVEEMSDIVWAVNPRHDRFDALAHRMRRFAGDTLGDIELEFDAASLPPDFSVPLEYRRPLYLVFKEAAHNVARHSGATRAAIRIELDEASLRLTVEDNGCGFDPQAPRPGEGIHSILRRMHDIGGAAWWEPAGPRGTRFIAMLPLESVRGLHKLGGIFARRAR